MSPPLRLPIIQNWSCHNCGGCCREHNIYISAADKSRIDAQNWPARLPPGQPLFIEEKQPFQKNWLRLAHQPDGACVFLTEQGLCRIHAEFGEAAKPLACRIYPYAFHPAGSQLAVSLRFSCPSVAENLGRSVVSQKADIQSLAGEVIPPSFRDTRPPPLKPGVQLDWKDTLRVAQTLDETLAADAPIAVKATRALFWLNLIEESKFQNIRGQKLNELLALLAGAAVMEIPGLPEEAPRPSGIARTQFRLLAGQYARKDTHGTVDRSLRGRLRQLSTALKLASGRSSLPRLSDDLRAVPLAALEKPFGPVPEESEAMLTRYLRVKTQGLHFCGKAYYEVPLIEGANSLALTLPSILWIARWRAAGHGRDRIEHSDVLHALTLVDHQHGYSPALGSWSFRRRVKILAATNEIPRLIAWLSQAGGR